MKKNRNLPADDILQYEAERNTRLLYNEVHLNAPMAPMAPYEDIVAEADIQPMPDEPPVPPPCASVTSFSYVRGNAPPERTQLATDHSQVRTRPYQEEVEVDNLLSHHNLPPHLSDGHYRVILHRQKHPLLPAPWVLTAGNVAPYDEFKPKILKEVDDFNGDSNDITRFFQKCELHFGLFNRHFFYPPHKVIFCVSRLTGDAQRWWELQSQMLGKNADGQQLYPTYEDFEAHLRARFWKGR